MKKILTLLLTILIIFTVSGCSNNQETVEENTPEVVEEPVEETVTITATGNNSQLPDEIPFSETSKLDVLSTSPASLSNGTAVALERYYLQQPETSGMLMNQLGNVTLMRNLFLDKNGDYLKYYSEVMIESLSDENYEQMKDLDEEGIRNYITNIFNEYASAVNSTETFTPEDFKDIIFAVETISDVERVLTSTKFVGIRYIEDKPTDNAVFEDEFSYYIPNENGIIIQYYKDGVTVKEAAIESLSDEWSNNGVTNLNELLRNW